MWFFDDDSDDEDDGKPRRIGLLDIQQSTTITQRDEKKNDVEEEDPLDAFMKGMNKEANDTKKRNGYDSTTLKFGGRLGVENEDEATSHWAGRCCCCCCCCCCC